MTGGTGRCRVTGGQALVGTIAVPGDKSISHRALLVAALADGRSTIHGLSAGDDVRRTRQAVAALGASVSDNGGSVVVEGGRGRLAPPPAPVDCGNSGTGMRLLAGVAAGLPGATVLAGDESLSSRPMDRIARPLALMGARVDGRGPRCLPPITVHGGPLVGIEYEVPVPSAQVKSAVLLAGLVASGETVVVERVVTRAHTEELLAAAGADIAVEQVGPGRRIRLRPSPLRPGRFDVPGDPSQAAFWVVAAVVVPGSAVEVPGVTLAPERTGFVEVLRRMGGRVDAEPGHGAAGTLRAAAGPLVGTVVEAAEIPSLDEIPILAVAAAVAHGPTRFRDAGELRVKESDRLAGTVALLAAFGAGARAEGDDLVVDGDAALRPATVDPRGDHRLAMAGALAGLACPGGGATLIEGWDVVATSYPGFAAAARTLGGRVDDGTRRAGAPG